MELPPRSFHFFATIMPLTHASTSLPIGAMMSRPSCLRAPLSRAVPKFEVSSEGCTPRTGITNFAKLVSWYVRVIDEPLLHEFSSSSHAAETRISLVRLLIALVDLIATGYSKMTTIYRASGIEGNKIHIVRLMRCIGLPTHYHRFGLINIKRRRDLMPFPRGEASN